MKTKKVLIAIIILIGSCNLAIAEADKPIVKSSKQDEIIKTENQGSEKKNLYKLLYENSVASNDRVITTIQWSIGIISSFVLLFLGSQVYFNHRVNKEEIGAIRSDLEESFSSFKSELLENINVDNNSKNKETLQSFEKLSHEFKDDLSKRLEEKEKYLDAKIESLQKEYSSLEKNTESVLSDLKIKNQTVNAEIWRLRGIEANALSRFTEIAKMEIENGVSPIRTLEEIVKSLAAMKKVRTDTCEELNELSKCVPDDCQELMAEIKGHISSLPKYMFVEDPNNPGQLKSVDI
jgi:hypothetical protein